MTSELVRYMLVVFQHMALTGNRDRDLWPSVSEENKSLLAQLNDAQTERAQLRTYLQVADTQDPSDVVDVFNKSNVSIKNSCLLTSSAVLKSVELKAEWTTKKCE